MNRIFIGIITAIVVAIAQPVRFNANVRFFTLQVIRWAGRVHWTSLMRLIRRCVVFTIVDSVADLRLRNAPAIQACKFTVGTGRIFAVQLIGAVFAVIFMIALPRLENAPAVVATELVG
jgi:hypothetical protein